MIFKNQLPAKDIVAFIFLLTRAESRLTISDSDQLKSAMT
jgi:hypothetical protein